jgi:hypothetical protein
MDKCDLAIIIFILTLLVAFLSLVGFLFIITQANNEEHICIEWRCPRNPYSSMYKPCNPVKCTISEDTVIDDTVYSIYTKYQVNVSTEIPDDAAITGTSWHGWDGCYQNETGQDPNDLVMHFTCPDGSLSGR